jgi:hypothetical protein
MTIVLLAWTYVVGMVALVEAFGAEGSFLGALVTLTLYGVLPLALLTYISGGSRRRRAARAAERAKVHPAGALATGTSDRVDPGGSGQPAGEAVAPVREEP